MSLTKQHAEAAYEAATATARRQQAQQSARHELKRRQIMPLRWSLSAIVLGVVAGALLYWIVFKQEPIVVIAISMVVAIAAAQKEWNRRIKA
ncbi:MAG TPA: hypothetical protein VMH83_08745 [Candidatus Acidoferrum sp.]|nr:hypothetical protein [Candidatus Acidoferrum sp.]